MNDANTVPSLSDLMHEAFYLSMDCGHSELSHNKTYFTPREKGLTDEESDLIFGWADGLTHAYYEKISSGQCSLQASIDFDVAKFEERVVKDIATMKAILNRVGKPVVLTKEDMRGRGYVVA
jgi:hypothetical protein